MKRFAVTLMHLAMLALVCAVAAYWAIRIMTPAPASVPPPPPPTVLRKVDPALAARLFGLVQAPAVQLALNVQALGAFAAGADSAAILAVDGKPARVFLLNQEVAAGARLVEVRRDAVAIEQAGARREFALPKQDSLGLGGSPPAPGFTREGNVLTAPSVAGSAPPAAVPGRPPLPPRPGALPQAGFVQPIPQPVQPQVQQQPMQQQPAAQAIPPADNTSPAELIRRATPGRPLSQ